MLARWTADEIGDRCPRTGCKLDRIFILRDVARERRGRFNSSPPVCRDRYRVKRERKKKDRDPHLSVYYIRIHREPFFLHQIFYGCLLIRNIVDSLVKHEISHVVTGLSTGFPFPVSMR